MDNKEKDFFEDWAISYKFSCISTVVHGLLWSIIFPYFYTDKIDLLGGVFAEFAQFLYAGYIVHYHWAGLTLYFISFVVFLVGFCYCYKVWKRIPERKGILICGVGACLNCVYFFAGMDLYISVF